MPNIPQVKIGNATYDIKDSVARNQIDDLRKTITSINMEFETGDLIISSGETDQDERFCHSDYINVEDMETNIFNLNGADLIKLCNYADDHSFINGKTYTADGYFSIASSAKYIRISMRKIYKSVVDIPGIQNAKTPWLGRIVNVDSFSDLYTNVVYYSNHIQVSGTGTSVRKKIYTQNISVNSASVYTMSCDKCVGYSYNGYLWAYQYDSSGNEISNHHNISDEDPLVVNVAANADHIDFWLRPTYGIPLSTGFCDYYGVRIFPGTEDQYTLTGRTNKLIYESGASGGFTIPEYYILRDYLKDKVSRINELIENTADNGDAFIAITDEHWEHPRYNTQNSPALINYVYRNSYVQRLFSIGDNADQGSKDYADCLRKAFGGKIYHAAGNHDYMYGTQKRESQLYAMWDVMNTDQIGEKSRHYYYVDNQQQKIRYVVLNAYKPSGSTDVQAALPGYETEQVNWMNSVAFNVDTGWSIVIFTHGLWTFNSEGTYAYVSERTNAQAVIDAIDAYSGNGEIIGVFCGHEHLDRIIYTPVKNIPVFYITCDANRVTQAYKEDPRNAGTKGEQAFDVVVLDKSNRTWTLIRIGMKAHDGVLNDWGNEVEERTARY